MVSNMSAISCSISGVILAMRVPFWRKAGCPYFTTGNFIPDIPTLARWPVAHQPGQILDARAETCFDIIAAGRNACEKAVGVIEAKQLPETEARVEMITGAGGDGRL